MTAGCYVWRVDRVDERGMPKRGRCFAYIGETSSREHRDPQHLLGQKAERGLSYAPAKPWSDLRPKAHALPMLFAHSSAARLFFEQLYMLLLWPKYNIKGNRWNPTRIKPWDAQTQRRARDRRRVLR